MHEADQPDTVGDLFDAEQLTGEDRADVDFAAFEADATAIGDQRCPVMKWVVEILEAFVGSG